MALIIKDRVKETTTTSGTIPFVCTGAVNEFQTFAASIGDANTTLYAAEDIGGINWEVGVGQYVLANNSLLRTTVLASSNNNSIVNFSAGPKNIFVTVPADYTALTSRDLTQFAVTSAANLASIISEETGTGSLVFANNAVLSNTTISGGLVIDQTQETLTTTSGVDGWSYVNSVSVVTQETAGHGISMSSDGTKMYIIGSTNDTVYQYTLSSAFDVSTATYSGLSKSVSATAGGPLSLYFKPDGTAFYIVNDSTSDTVQRYNLSTAWNISTASYLNSFTFTQETAPTGLEFSPDGTRLHIIGTATDTVYQFALSTAWDLSSAATTPTYSYSIASQAGTPQGIEFNDTGTRMYIIGTTTDAILQYNLSTAWDLTTAVYDSRLLLMSGGYTINSPRDIYTDFSNNIALIIDEGADRIFQFATNTNALKITGNHFIVEPKTIFNNELGVYGLSRFFGAIEATGNIAVSGTLSGTITATGTLTAASTIALSGSTTSTTSLGTAASTGTTDIGGTGQTGAITVGRSTATQTLNLGTGATSSGSIKTINIGTAGVAGSNTNINIGSAASGGNVYFNQPVETIDPLTIRRSPSQFLTIQNDDTTVSPFIKSFSANNNAKPLYFDCSTVDLTPVTAGSLGYIFRINGTNALIIDNSGTSIFTNTSTGPAVKINQTGAGPALLVEDETSTDASPFVIDATGNVGIGTNSPLGKLGIVGSTVGANVGDQTIYTTLSSSDNGVNNDIFQISNIRLSTGAGWTGSGTRLQQKVDSSWMGYMQFNGNTNNGGISFGTGQTTTSANSIPEVFRINSSGAVGIGTTNPTAKLDVVGSVKISQDLSVSGSLSIASNTLVANLNSDMLDGKTVGTSGSVIPILDGNNIWAGEQRFQSTATYMGDPSSNTYIEFSRATNYPFIDFHSNTNVDFSGRIGCSGTTAGSGGGTLDFQAAAYQFYSGNFTAGGSYGTITLGTASQSQIVNIGTGATGSGNTKSIGFGTSGVAGSTTNINIGSAVQGALGKTIANQGMQLGSNGTPIYQTKLDFGSDAAGTWRKLFTVSLGTGQYQTAAYKIDIVDPNANHAVFGSINADKYTYYVACIRTESTVQDYPDACYISGPASHIRAVRLSTGNYEIQVANEIIYQEYLISVQLYAENGGQTAATYYDGSALASVGANTYTAAVGTATDWFQQVRIASSGAGDALRITQTGSGNALLVEDSANPDADPFVIKADGNIITGAINQVAGAEYNPRLEIVGNDPSGSGLGQFHYSNDTLASRHQFNKTRATAPAGHVIVASNDELGTLTFAGSDGTGYIRGAQISAYVDGTPGTNDMPGRLVFSTTADGASSPTEAMRITNAQQIGIGTTSPTAKLDVVGSVKISQDLSVSGNVYISGNTTVLSSNNLVINDSIIYLANNNPANLNDIGFVGNFTSGVYQHTGLVRDATDGVWKLFSNVVSEPTNTVDFTDAIYDSVRVGTANATAIITSSVTAPSTDLTLNAVSTGSITFTTIGGTQFKVTNANSAVNYIQATGATTGNNPTLSAQGSDSNVGLLFQTKGTGSHQFASGTSSAFVINSQPTNVNYGIFTSTAAGVSPLLQVAGSDTNVDFRLRTQGTGAYQFDTGSNNNTQFKIANYASATSYIQVTGGINGGAAKLGIEGTGSTELHQSSLGLAAIKFFTRSYSAEQFRVADTASAVNYAQTTGAATGSGPTLSAQGTDTNVDFNIASKGSGSVNFATSGGTQFRVLNTGAVNNYIAVTGQSNASPGLWVAGASTDIGLNISSKGAGQINFQTNTFGSTQFSIANISSAVNYIQVTGNSTTNAPAISAQGSDAAINLVLAPKNGYLNVYSNNGSQFRVTPVASAVNFLQATGASVNNEPTLSAQGSDTNIDLSLVAKGTGSVKTASTLVAGLISGGTF